MNAVDTNVFVYFFDDEEPAKQAQATALLDPACSAAIGNGVAVASGRRVVELHPTLAVGGKPIGCRRECGHPEHPGYVSFGVPDEQSHPSLPRPQFAI
jgi:hypothetical protein